MDGGADASACGDVAVSAAVTSAMVTRWQDPTEEGLAGDRPSPYDGHRRPRSSRLQPLCRPLIRSQLGITLDVRRCHKRLLRSVVGPPRFQRCPSSPRDVVSSDVCKIGGFAAREIRPCGGTRRRRVPASIAPTTGGENRSPRSPRPVLRAAVQVCFRVRRTLA